MNIKQVVLGVAVAWMLQIASVADARVYSPRVVSPHNADAYSMKTFAEYPLWRDLYGDAKAWEMFKYLTDQRTGLYPLGMGAYEGNSSTYEHSLVRDPVKMINVYSTGYCDVLGPVMAGIWEDAGFGKARVVDVPWMEHVTAEVYYDNSWHYLDLDLRAAFRRPDGTLASLQDSRSEPSLWNRPNGPRFFPLDDLGGMRLAYEQSELPARYGVAQSGHTMDFTLRQGETFTRWWEPQGGRWQHNDIYNSESWVRDIIETAPRGPKSKHPSFSVHTHGNGHFVYQPKLSQPSSDFIDGVYDSQNVEPGTNGLTLSQSGTGYAVFEVRSPYVIVPIVGNTSTTSDDYDASVIEIDASNARYSISVDSGITWTQVYLSGNSIDLTSQVAGKYSYLFKVELNGDPGQAVVRSMNMSTWVQLAPASLPSLRQGNNRMNFITGDHYGLQTRLMDIQPDAEVAADFNKHIVVAPDEYNPGSFNGRIRGPFVVAVVPPPETKIAWFSAGGSFESYQRELGPFTTFTMDYAADVPFAFNQFYSADMPADMEHWHSNAQAEVRLAEPASAVYLRYEGSPSVNNIRIFAHVVEDSPRAQSPVRITHKWYDGGQLKTFSTTTANGSGYDIQADQSPVDVSLEMSVDSDLAGEPPSPPPPPIGGLTTITWPSSGSVLPAGSSSIYFSPGAREFDQWRITLGSDTDAQGLYDSGVRSLFNSPWEQIISGVPSNGAPVYLRFWQRLGGGAWATSDTMYATEFVDPPEPPPPEPPPPQPPRADQAMISWPPAGAVLSNQNNTIYFSPGTGGYDEWRITVGNSPDAQGVFDSGVRNLFIDPWEQNIGNVPASGEPLYLRFWQKTPDGAWVYFDTEYATDIGNPEPPVPERPPEPPVQERANITWPLAGDVLTGDTTIYFNPGGRYFNEWRMTVSSDAAGTSRLYDSGVKDILYDSWQEVIGQVPANGSVYLRFWQRNYGGEWSAFDTVYRTVGSQ